MFSIAKPRTSALPVTPMADRLAANVVRRPHSGFTRVGRLALTLALACAFAFPTAANAQTGQAQSAQNSTRKIRVQPQGDAKRIGSGISWADDVESALKQSRESGKPVFWYVPTLPDTFMDRKTEIHRYMLAGPFSWPAIIDTLNEHTIPVKQIPTPALQKKYGLEPYKFVEPGYIILDRRGQAVDTVDRMTTLHPHWLLELLNRQLKPNTTRAIYQPQLKQAWEDFSLRRYDRVLELAADNAFVASLQDEAKCQWELLTGMAQFRQGNHQAAKSTWAALAKSFPEHPLAWKAAAEAQNFGPFVRGFEVHTPLTPQAILAGTESAGSAAPLECFDRPALWQRSVDFLLGMQHQNGAFYDSDYDYGGTDSLPNVHVAVTSLAGWALLKAYHQPQFQARRDELKSAIDRALLFAVDDANVNKVDRDEILWAYAYRLRFLSACLQSKIYSPPLDAPQTTLAKLVQSLESVQSRRGSWYHEYNNPFVTATALVALREAADLSAPVQSDVLAKGTANLASERFANGAFPYGSSRQPPRQTPPGTPKQLAASAGRMPLCELALLLGQQSTPERLAEAVDQSLNLHANLDSALKYDNHTSNLAYGGFFFWYDMRSRSEAISQIADAELRQKHAERQNELILKLPELDGCFVDSHELGRVYGTAMALLSFDPQEDAIQ